MMKTKSYTLKTQNSEYIITDINKPGIKRFYGKSYPDGVEIENAPMNIGVPFMTRFTNNEENIKNGLAGKFLRTSNVINIEETNKIPVKQQEMNKQYIVKTNSGTIYSFEEAKNGKDSNDVILSCQQKGYHGLPVTLSGEVRENKPFIFTVRNSPEGEKLGLIGKTVVTSPVLEIHTIETPISTNIKQRETIDIDYDSNQPMSIDMNRFNE